MPISLPPVGRDESVSPSASEDTRAGGRSKEAIIVLVSTLAANIKFIIIIIVIVIINTISVPVMMMIIIVPTEAKTFPILLPLGHPSVAAFRFPFSPRPLHSSCFGITGGATIQVVANGSPTRQRGARSCIVHAKLL